MTDKQQEILNHLIRLKEVSQTAKEELADLRRWIQEEAPRIAVEESRKILERAERAETFNEKWEQDYSILLANRDAAIQRAESANRECDEWRERRDLAIIRAEEAEEREDKAIQRAEKAEAERDQLRRGLKQAEQVAQETISILADDHHDEDAGCRFTLDIDAEDSDVGCLACLAQIKLAGISTKALTPEALSANSISPGDGTLRIKKP